jgi:hypothetical protein
MVINAHCVVSEKEARRRKVLVSIEQIVLSRTGYHWVTSKFQD